MSDSVGALVQHPEIIVMMLLLVVSLQLMISASPLESNGHFASSLDYVDYPTITP